MDYWKDVPGIEEGVNTDVVRAIRSELTHISSRLDYLATSGTKDKRFKKAEGFVDKARKILFDLQESKLKESSGMDSNYLRDSLGNLIDDIKRDEKDLAKVLQWVWDRVNQSIPDGDVTSADIGEFLTEPDGRKLLRKSGESKADIADMILNI